ncbi:MAG: hypothetical protein MH252_08490 [Thermosynechococcaceae cyanobacterium MS004]|nr:hypothetical protein [Thermosynechococcaceae cyanobacterium MS004]
MPASTRYYRGQGKLYLYNRTAAGRPENGIFLGNVPELSTSINVENIEHAESMTGQQLTDLRVNTKTQAMLSATLENYSTEVLAIALRGTASTTNAGTVTAEPKAALKGRFIKLNRMNLTTFTSLTGIGGTPVYVNGTDYVVNLATGSIEILSTGAIPDSVDGANNVAANYAFGAQESVAAMTAVSKNHYLIFEGLNTAEGNKPVVVEAYKVYFDPAAEESWINNGNEVSQFQLEGEVLWDDLQATDDKFFKVIQTVRA